MTAKIDTTDMKQAYVVGPISAYKDQEWNVAAFRRCKSKVENLLGIECKIPHEFIPEKAEYEDQMSLSFAFLENEVDILIRLDDSAPSPGADREVEYASALGIPVIHETDLREENIAMDFNEAVLEDVQTPELVEALRNALDIAGADEDGSPRELDSSIVADFDKACQQVMNDSKTLASLCTDWGIEIDAGEGLVEATNQWAFDNAMSFELWNWED